MPPKNETAAGSSCPPAPKSSAEPSPMPPADAKLDAQMPNSLLSHRTVENSLGNRRSTKINWKSVPGTYMT